MVPLLLVALTSLVSVVMLVMAAREASRRSPLRREGEVAVGQVVDNAQGEPAPEGWFLPVVQFRTDAGRLVRATGDQPSRRPFPEGLPLPVIYDPRQPSRITVGADRVRVLIVGAVVSAVSAALLAVVLLILY